MVIEGAVLTSFDLLGGLQPLHPPTLHLGPWSIPMVHSFLISDDRALMKPPSLTPWSRTHVSSMCGLAPTLLRLISVLLEATMASSLAPGWGLV